MQHPPYAPSSYQHPPYSSAPPPPTSIPPHLAFDRSSHSSVAPYAHPDPLYQQRLEDTKRVAGLGARPSGSAPAYGESVKRHLENFDYEASLNEIADANAHLLEFSNTYRRLAHQALPGQANGGGSAASESLSGSTPGMAEIDEMIRKSSLMHQALLRVKDLIVEQNVSANEQQRQQQQERERERVAAQQQQHHAQHPSQHPSQAEDRYGAASGYRHDDLTHHAPPPPGSLYGDDAKGGAGGAGYAGGDPKKPRRGVRSRHSLPPLSKYADIGLKQRAAPPGRCHSCNRAETPEWRRGPDGARTLCNACGLRTFLFLFSHPKL